MRNLSKASHAAIRGTKAEMWENRFRIANQDIENGKPYIPFWWNLRQKREYEDYLIQQGWLI